MFFNHLKTAFRNLWRQKFYTIINILGLSTGLGICLLILIFVRDELSYDRYHSNADRIHRVIMAWTNNSTTTQTPWGPYRLAPALETDFPELEQVVRVSSRGGGLVEYGTTRYNEERIFIADPEIFQVFDFEVIQGNPETALLEPFKIMISETTAEKYFGTEEPVGKVLRFFDQYDATVTGVFRDVPRNSHFHADFFISMETGKQVFNQLVLNNWGELSQHTYVLLPPEISKDDIEARLPDFIEKNMGEGSSEGIGMTLQPLKEIYLNPDYPGEFEPHGNKRNIYVASAIALFIILIACINYMNLATARSVKRATEIGVRKTLGAPRSALIRQFLTEAVLLAFIAFGLAIFLVWLALPPFNAFVGKTLTINPAANGSVFPWFLLTTLAVGLIAGSYPALYLSSIEAVKVFQEKVRQQSASGNLRKSLVVFQFAISIILIAATIIVFNQWNYMRSKDLGYNRDNLVLVPIPGTAEYPTLKEQLERNPDIVSVAASNKRLTGALSSNLGFDAENFEEDPKNPASIKIVTVDYDFLKTLEAPFAAGRDFDEAYGSDAREAFILNEAAVRLIGWEEPIGKWFKTSEFVDGAWEERNGKVIGVVKDLNMESLYNTIEPVVYYISEGWLNWMTIRLNGVNTSKTIDYIKQQWVQYGSEEEFDYMFLDDRIAEMYRTEERFFNLFTAFTLLAIFIASLGIFGLSAFTAEQRTKEIGVRKVFGASAPRIIVLLLKEFTALVGIGFLIGAPVAFFLMRRWLQDFTYRIDLGLLPFLLAGLAAVLLAWLTAGIMSAKAATANPVRALKYE